MTDTWQNGNARLADQAAEASGVIRRDEAILGAHQDQRCRLDASSAGDGVARFLLITVPFSTRTGAPGGADAVLSRRRANASRPRRAGAQQA